MRTIATLNATGGLSLRDILVTVVIVVAVPICFLRPFFGLLMWTWVSYFNPQQFTWGFAREVRVGLLVAVPTILGLLVSRSRRLPPLTRETLLLLLLWVWFGLTTVNVYFSPTFFHHFPDTLDKFVFVSKVLIMTFVAMMLVIDFNRLRWWYLVTVGCFGLLVLRAAVFGIISGGQFRVYGPPGSMIGDNNDFALAVNMVLPMFWYLGGAERLPLIRATLRFAVLCGVISVILTYSRAGLLGLVAVLLAIGLKSRHKFAAVAGVVVLGILVLALTPHEWMGRMETIRGAAQTDLSAQSRLRSWDFAARLAKDYPLMGGGFDTFTNNLASRYSVEGEELQGPHSIYFQMLAEQGFTGLILYVTLLFSSLWTCRNLNRRFKRDAPWVADYASMAQVGLVGYAVNGAFLGRAYFDLFFQLVATVIVLQFLAGRELTSRSDEIMEFRVTSSRSEEVSVPG